MNADMLPDDLLFTEDGHASDVVLTCLADGETAIVPELARAHVSGCVDCQGHLGNAALLSLRATDDVLAHLRSKEKSTEQATVHSPYVALAVGLTLAVLGALPRLATLPDDLASGTKSVAEGAPPLLRLVHHGVLALGHVAETRGAFVSMAAGLLLITFAVVVAHRASRSTSTPSA